MNRAAKTDPVDAIRAAAETGGILARAMRAAKLAGRPPAPGPGFGRAGSIRPESVAGLPGPMQREALLLAAETGLKPDGVLAAAGLDAGSAMLLLRDRARIRPPLDEGGQGETGKWDRPKGGMTLPEDDGKPVENIHPADFARMRRALAFLAAEDHWITVGHDELRDLGQGAKLWIHLRGLMAEAGLIGVAMDGRRILVAIAPKGRRLLAEVAK